MPGNAVSMFQGSEGVPLTRHQDRPARRLRPLHERRPTAWAGLASTTLRSETDWLTTARAPATAPLPTVVPGPTKVPLAAPASASIRIGAPTRSSVRDLYAGDAVRN